MTWAVWVAAAFAVSGCVMESAPAEGGPGEENGQVAESLGTEDPGTPVTRTGGTDGVRASSPNGADGVTTTVVQQQSDPDPEPWHGGTQSSNSGSGKHD